MAATFIKMSQRSSQ